MKICYHSDSGLKHYVGIDFIPYLKKIMTLDKKINKLWSERIFSLVSDDKENVYWTKKLEDIIEKDFKINE